MSESVMACEAARDEIRRSALYRVGMHIERNRRAGVDLAELVIARPVWKALSKELTEHGMPPLDPEGHRYFEFMGVPIRPQRFSDIGNLAMVI